jgi:hypothetical protein
MKKLFQIYVYAITIYAALSVFNAISFFIPIKILVTLRKIVSEFDLIILLFSIITIIYLFIKKQKVKDFTVPIINVGGYVTSFILLLLHSVGISMILDFSQYALLLIFGIISLKKR